MNAAKAMSGTYQEPVHLHPFPRFPATQVLNARAAGQGVKPAEFLAVRDARRDGNPMEVVALAVLPSACAAEVEFRVAAVHLLVAAVYTSSLSSPAGCAIVFQ
jgi:hypothetical protein